MGSGIWKQLNNPYAQPLAVMKTFRARGPF